MKSLTLRKLRDLDLQVPTSAGRPAYLSAASGLVIVKSTAYVVADDEQHLGVFSLTKNTPGTLLRIVAGDLPNRKKPRKKLKADMEVLLLLPPFRSCRHGALFALGSGSTKKRRRGVLLPLNAKCLVTDTPRLIDLAPWFEPIEDAVGDLNIEGAVIANGRLNLLQRGNTGEGINAHRRGGEQRERLRRWRLLRRGGRHIGSERAITKYAATNAGRESGRNPCAACRSSHSTASS